MHAPNSVVAAMAILAGTAAAATSPPGDGNVIVVQPLDVTVPGKLPADCHVEASVREVWAGDAYRAGQTISLDVPCSDGRPRMEFADPQASASAPQRPLRIDPVVLRKHPRAAVHLDDGGHLIWTSTRKAYGTLGRVAGFRVLDGVGIAVTPQKS